MRGARAVTASETESGRAWAESRIKQLTGGDKIGTRLCLTPNAREVLKRFSFSQATIKVARDPPALLGRVWPFAAPARRALYPGRGSRARRARRRGAQERRLQPDYRPYRGARGRMPQDRPKRTFQGQAWAVRARLSGERRCCQLVRASPSDTPTRRISDGPAGRARPPRADLTHPARSPVEDGQ